MLRSTVCNEIKTEFNHLKVQIYKQKFLCQKKPDPISIRIQNNFSGSVFDLTLSRRIRSDPDQQHWGKHILKFLSTLKDTKKIP